MDRYLFILVNYIICIVLMLLLNHVISTNSLSIQSKYTLDSTQIKSTGNYYITLDLLNILVSKETYDIKLEWNPYNSAIRSDVMQKIVSYHLPDSISGAQLNQYDHAIGHLSVKLNLFADYNTVLDSLATSITPWILHILKERNHITTDGGSASSGSSWNTILKLLDSIQPHMYITNNSISYQLDRYHKLAVIYKSTPSQSNNQDNIKQEYNWPVRDHLFLDLSPTSCLWKNHKHRKHVKKGAIRNNNSSSSTDSDIELKFDIPKNTLKLDGYYLTRDQFGFIPHGLYDKYTDEWVVNDKYRLTNKTRKQKSAVEWYRSLCADAIFYRVDGIDNKHRICTHAADSSIYLYKTAKDKIVSSTSANEFRKIGKSSKLISVKDKLVLCLDYRLDKSIVPTSFLYDENNLESIEGLGIIFEDTAPGRPFVMIRENLIEKSDDEYDDNNDEGDGKSNKNVIVWGRREINRYIDYMNYDAAEDRYVVVFCGESSSIVSRMNSEMLIDPSMIPEIDWWRGIFIIVIITFLMRRSLSRNNELQIAILECTIEHKYIAMNTNEWERLASPHLTILAIDPFIYSLFIISGIWYIAALSTILPPAPTYVTFWLWVSIAIVSFLFGLLLLISHYIYTYAKTGCSTCLSDSMSYTIIGATLFDFKKTDVAIKRPVSIAYIMILRAMGYIVGISSLLFALWWDTDDTFHWGLVSITLFIASVYLTYHTFEMWILIILFLKKTIISFKSIVTIIYSLTILTITGLITGYGFTEVILPFLQSVNVVYLPEVVTFGMWIMYIFFAGICISMIHSDIIKMKNVLHHYSKRNNKNMQVSKNL